METTFLNKLFQAHKASPACPPPGDVSVFFTGLLGTLFADFNPMAFTTEAELQEHIHKLKKNLAKILNYSAINSESISTAADLFFDYLPQLYDKLNEDVNAMFEGDPAAKSRSEVIRTYPGFYAIAAYRMAHELYQLGVKEVPRIITEHAHSKTGVDIHPAARIGKHFCIDHGTGVVIGETAVIGNRVKIYQGVTLGALSVSKEDAERKRHPTIEDNVVIYAGATILGGETVIGHSSIIGGNVWLTQSVPPHSKIYYQSKMYNGDTGQTDVVIFKSGHE
jgi:serine O-acetyltransferase